MVVFFILKKYIHMKFTYIYIFLKNILCLINEAKIIQKIIIYLCPKSRVNDGVFLSFLSIREFFPMNFYNPCLRRKITQ